MHLNFLNISFQGPSAQSNPGKEAPICNDERANRIEENTEINMGEWLITWNKSSLNFQNVSFCRK